MAGFIKIQARSVSLFRHGFSSRLYYLSTLHKLSYSRTSDEDYWVERLNHRDWLSPNELIKIFTNIQDPNLIVSSFRKAISRVDYKPNEALYAVMVERLAFARKFDEVEALLERAKSERFKFSEDFFYRLVKMYGNVANDSAKAIETLQKMPQICSSPSVKSFNYVLNLLVNTRRFEIVHEVYLTSQKLGITIDTCCFNILIKGLCKNGKFEAALYLFDEMPKQNCKPNTTSYSTLIHHLCINNKIQEAFDLYNTMCKDETTPPDTILFNILISALCRNERVNEAMELLKEMSVKNVYPNSGTYEALLSGLIRSKRYIEAKEFIGMMVGQNVRPSFSSYKVTIHGLCNMKCINEVHVVLNHMVEQGFAPRIGTWSKIIKCLFY